MAIKVKSPTDGPALSEFLAKLDVVEEERDGWLCRCPAHDDSHASLRVTVSEASGKVLVKCRVGCPNSKIMKAVGLTLKDLAAMESDLTGAHTTASVDQLPDDATIAGMSSQLDIWAADLHTPAGSDARAYASLRFGIEPEDMRRLGLGVTTSLGGGPRLVVPFRDKSGRALGYQARALNNVAQVRWSGPRNPEGAAWTRLGYFPGTSGWEEVIVTEGPGDALTAVSTGYDALAIRGAGLVTDEATLDHIADMLDGRVAIIAGDGDDAGQQFSARLASELMLRGVTVKTMKMRDNLDLTDWRAEDPAWFKQGFVKEVARLKADSRKEAIAAQWPYPFADVGAAQFLRDKLANEGKPVKFTDAKGFYQLENGVWTSKSDGDMRTIVQGVGADLRRIIARGDLGNRSKDAQDYQRYSETTRGIDSMLKELKSVAGVRAKPEDFDNQPHLLAVRNGIVDLRTGELEPHNPSYLLTRRVDLNYYPDAQAPRWQLFLNEVFPDQPEVPGYLQRIIGYGITGENAEQCFVVHYGTGANGKSIFTDAITEVFKAITTTTPFSTFEARRGDGVPNDLAALAGARLVMAPEGNQGKLMDEALLKRVTGRDLITARFLRREFFEFHPQFLLQMMSNYRPAFKGQDEGLWRRVKLIEWRQHFGPDRRDPDLPAKIMAEAEGILAWAVAGAVAWYAGGLQEPAAITAVTEDYRRQSDVLVDFIGNEVDCVFTEGDTSDWVARTELFREFQDWADAGNFRDLAAWSSRAFYRAVEERGFPASKRNGVIGFKKIKRAINDPWANNDTMGVENNANSPLSGPKLDDLWEK